MTWINGKDRSPFVAWRHARFECDYCGHMGDLPLGQNMPETPAGWKLIDSYVDEADHVKAMGGRAPQRMACEFLICPRCLLLQEAVELLRKLSEAKP